MPYYKVQLTVLSAHQEERLVFAEDPTHAQAQLFQDHRGRLSGYDFTEATRPTPVAFLPHVAEPITDPATIPIVHRWLLISDPTYTRTEPEFPPADTP